MQVLPSKLIRDQAKHNPSLSNAALFKSVLAQMEDKWWFGAEGHWSAGVKMPGCITPSIKCDILNARLVPCTFWQLKRKESEIFQSLITENRWRQGWKLLWFLQWLFQLLYQLISDELSQDSLIEGVWQAAMMLLLYIKGIFLGCKYLTLLSKKLDMLSACRAAAKILEVLRSWVQVPPMQPLTPQKGSSNQANLFP